MRDNPMQELAIAQTIGQDAGKALDRILTERRRNNTQRELVRVLSNGAALGLKPEQMLEGVLQIPNIVQTQIGQELMQMQMGVGRYFETDLDARYKESRIKYYEDLASRQAGQKAALDNFKYWTDIINKNQTALDNHVGKFQTGDLSEVDADYVAKLQRNIAEAEGEKRKAWEQYQAVPETAPTGDAGVQVPTAAPGRPNVPVPTAERPDLSFAGPPVPTDLAGRPDPSFAGPPPPADLVGRPDPSFNIGQRQGATWQQVIDQIPGLGGTRNGKPTVPVAAPKKADAAVAREVGLETVDDVMPKLLGYLPALDVETRLELMQLIREGDPVKLGQALQIFEKEYGTP
jgi:hypothetical protein